jgi:GMP synthase-like glutamine amidotransferase
MNIYEEDKHPWLAGEKLAIRAALGADKAVLGVCLGAQLLADVLGGPVTKNAQKEIGWFPVKLRPEAAGCPLLAGWPETLETFHWHGDTFAIPPGARHLASSAACVNQAFLHGDRALGLQFHMEYRADSIRAMLKECDDEIDAGGPFVQSYQTILDGLPKLPPLHACLEGTLAAFESMLS